MRIELLIIDPQMDFCDYPGRPGSLAVPGAHADMQRLSTFIDHMGARLADVHITLDSHHPLDIAHPGWWLDKKGQMPAPFTLISYDDVEKGKWTPRLAEQRERCLQYLLELKQQGKYDLCIWPEHCLIGSAGHAIHPDVFAAVARWERANLAVAGMVTKGSNPFTEHYSGLRAEVPDPMDPSTQLNVQLIETLNLADEILIAGEALSHCVANTVRDIAQNFDPDALAKLVLLTDATSSVPGFESVGADFVSEMVAKGMRTATTTTYQSGRSVRKAAQKALTTV